MDKLSVFNDALLRAGERKLSGLADNNKAARVLATLWDGGAVDYCLEQAYWKFSLRTVALIPDPNVSPSFGLAFAYNRPDDYLRTYMVCSDPYYNAPLMNYQLDGTHFYAEEDAIYLRYVSKVNGADFDLWPPSFVAVVASYLAWRCAPELTNAKTEDRLNKRYADELRMAMNKDVTENPPDVRRNGTWSRARGRSHSAHGRR